MLTNYNGQTITYDEIGNPINYRNGMTMSWQAGRQLESITQNGKTYSFTYAHDGLRTKKSITLGNTTVDVNYVYEGDKLLQMTYDNYVLTFSYDANGIPVSFHVTNGYDIDTDYYYGVNSRGDVIALYNANGSLYTTYRYDAYGKLMSGAPSSAYDIANLNPLRYRGYVYDNETGLYYLQSRYYDPVTCRFINADEYVSTGQDINGFNMFAYCNNNPVNYSDPTGTKIFECCPYGDCPYCKEEKKEYIEFLDALGMRESSDDYTKVNERGYLGRYQMGDGALIDAGFMDDEYNWTPLANRYGVDSKDSFLAAPRAQDYAVTQYHSRLVEYIEYYEIDSFVGTTYCGITITQSGLLAACHLVGHGGVMNELFYGIPAEDGNGVVPAEYLELFSDYNVSLVW